MPGREFGQALQSRPVQQMQRLEGALTVPPGVGQCLEAVDLGGGGRIAGRVGIGMKRWVAGRRHPYGHPYRHPSPRPEKTCSGAILRRCWLLEYVYPPSAHGKSRFTQDPLMAV